MRGCGKRRSHPRVVDVDRADCAVGCFGKAEEHLRVRCEHRLLERRFGLMNESRRTSDRPLKPRTKAGCPRRTLEQTMHVGRPVHQRLLSVLRAARHSSHRPS